MGWEISIIVNIKCVVIYYYGIGYLLLFEIFVCSLKSVLMF